MESRVQGGQFHCFGFGVWGASWFRGFGVSSKLAQSLLRPSPPAILIVEDVDLGLRKDL